MFCARMRMAIAAGLESVPIGVITTPGTKKPQIRSGRASLAASLSAGRNGPLVQFRPEQQRHKKRGQRRVTSRERRIPCEYSTDQLGKGDTMTTFHRRPQFQAPIYKLPSARAAETEDDQMPAENLSELLGRVSKNSTGEIDSLMDEFARLRGKLQTDSQRLQREIEEYAALSQQVMQLTKTISESVEKVRASVDRPTRVAQEKE